MPKQLPNGPMTRKYTVELPVSIYDELKVLSDKNGTSVKEVFRQALKFGLVALKIEEDPNTEIWFKERVPVPDEGGVPKYEVQESRVRIFV